MAASGIRTGKRFPDIYVILILVILVIIGANAIYNVSTFYKLTRINDALLFFRRYLGILGISCVGLVVFAVIDLRKLERLVPALLIISLLSLALVLVPFIGTKVNGARRWIQIFGYNFQPSEFAKIAFVLYLSSVLHRKGEKIASFFRGVLPPLIVTALFVVLITIEPDLGTALLFLGVAFAMFFFAGVKAGQLIFIGVLALPVLFIIVTNNTHMWYRVIGWLNPWDHATTYSFQLVQSLKCFMSGGFFGSSLEYLAENRISLPAASTDFILAVIAQKSGFFGAATVAVLFGALTMLGMRFVRKTGDPFAQNLAFGAVCMITLQATINLLVVVGLLPTTGIPLPFISYGRNALFVMMIFMGILLNVSRGRYE